MSIHSGKPRYTLYDLAENRRFQHHIEWATDGWEYRTTRVLEADHPEGWEPEPPAGGWELNVDRWPAYDEETASWERVGPGVLRNPYASGGAVLVAHWRRKR